MDLIAILLKPENLAALITLTILEIALGIDNIVFISIISSRLEPAKQGLARKIGLSLALLVRIIFLTLISWLLKLETIDINIAGFELTIKSLILLAGGIFLVFKATSEIHKKIELTEEEVRLASGRNAFLAVVVQIALLDIVFSIESIITAVGMAKELLIMVLAVIISIAIMITFIEQVSNFINKHASMKILALAFLLLIGVLLIAEGTGYDFPRGYVYASMAFSLFVQLLNIRYETKLRQKSKIAKESS